jgi:hypothetical protein
VGAGDEQFIRTGSVTKRASAIDHGEVQFGVLKFDGKS